MYLRIHGDRLIASDLKAVYLYDISINPPQLLKTVPAPCTQNPFTRDQAGERLSNISQGKVAHSTTPPGQKDHWAGHHSEIALFDTDLNTLQTLAVGRRLDDRTLALSPDGLKVASVSRGAGVVIFDANSGATLAEYKGDIASGVSWSPDGRWIAAGDTDQGGGDLYLLDTHAAPSAARKALPKPKSKAPLYDSPFESSFSPDGALVAFASAAWGKRGLSVYDASTGAEHWSVAFNTQPGDGEEDEEGGEGWQALDVAFALGGLVVLTGIEQGLRAYRASDGQPLTGLPCEGSGPFFAPDDARGCVWFFGEDGPSSSPYPPDWT